MTPGKLALGSEDYPTLDGFLFKTKLRANLTFANLVLREYEALRRSGAYRSRAWCTPNDSQVQIAAFDCLEQQVWMKPGSAIWGWTFTGTVNDDGTAASFNVRDACGDIPWFSEHLTKPAGAPTYQQQYLSKLYVVSEPGLLNVTIANTSGEAVTAQLILYGGEPVDEPCKEL